MPDKAVALLDNACARVAVSQSAPPAQLEDCLRQLTALETELAIAEREARMGVGDPQRIATLTAARDSGQILADSLKQRWQQERSLVSEIIRLRRAVCRR